MWHFGLGAVSSVAGWIWHSGINARWLGSIYHSQHQWCCWNSNGHVAWKILYRFRSSKRSCCIYLSYYIWRCYTSYTHKYKRYVIQSLRHNTRRNNAPRRPQSEFSLLWNSQSCWIIYVMYSQFTKKLFWRIVLLLFFQVWNLDLKLFLQIFEFAFAVILGFEKLHYKVSICNVVCILQTLYFKYSIMYTFVLFVYNMSVVFYIYKF